MDILQYVKSKRGSAAMLARTLSVSGPYVWQWASGVRRVPLQYAPIIERATGGAVTCEELRRDVNWRRVEDDAWPHQDGRPCVDVAAIAQQAA